MNPKSMQATASVLPPRADYNSQIAAKRDRRCLKVEEGYKRWAPTYDSTPNPLLALEQRCLMPLLPSLKGKRVLDLACGTGRWLKILLELQPRLGIGMDLSSSMLRIAQKKNSLQGALTRADCTRLPFRDRCFDLVMFSFVLSHISDLDSTITGLARIMKPHSDLYISDIHPEAYDKGWRTGFRDHTGSAEIEQWSRSLTSITELLVCAGFSCLKILSYSLDQPERAIFDRAGKAKQFESLQQGPAIYVCHFKLRESL